MSILFCINKEIHYREISYTSTRFWKGIYVSAKAMNIESLV